MTTIKRKMVLFVCVVGLLLAGHALFSDSQAGVHPLLVPTDSSADVYRAITDQGYNYEVSDDARHGNHHSERHITLRFDPFLNRNVFALHLHHNSTVTDTWSNRAVLTGQTNDIANSQRIDRQRNELKTDATSPQWGQARQGDSAVYRWKFMLPEGFVASAQFTHLHQLKAVGGDESQPIITMTARRRTGETAQEMQLIYRYASDSAIDRNRYLLERIPLEDFLGEWVEVVERVVYSTNAPEFEFRAVRVRDQRVLMHYVYEPATWDIEVPFRTIRPGNNFVRPKWGIYRAILRNVNGVLMPVEGPLRDETVLYADIEIVTGGR